MADLFIISRGAGSVPLVDGYFVTEQMALMELQGCIKVSPKTVLSPPHNYKPLTIGKEFFESARDAFAYMHKALDERGRAIQQQLDNNNEVKSRLSEIERRYLGEK